MRKKPERAHVPVILFSANDEIESISKNIHAYGYLRKPFDIDDLKKIVAQALSDTAA